MTKNYKQYNKYFIQNLILKWIIPFPKTISKLKSIDLFNKTINLKRILVTSTCKTISSFFELSSPSSQIIWSWISFGLFTVSWNFTKSIYKKKKKTFKNNSLIFFFKTYFLELLKIWSEPVFIGLCFKLFPLFCEWLSLVANCRKTSKNQADVA